MYEIWYYRKCIATCKNFVELRDKLIELFPQYTDEFFACDDTMANEDYSNNSLEMVCVNHECCSINEINHG